MACYTQNTHENNSKMACKHTSGRRGKNGGPPTWRRFNNRQLRPTHVYNHHDYHHLYCSGFPYVDLSSWSTPKVGMSTWLNVWTLENISVYRNQERTYSRTRYKMHPLGVISGTGKSYRMVLRGEFTKFCCLTVGSRLSTTKLTRTDTTPPSVTNTPHMLHLKVLVDHTKHYYTFSLISMSITAVPEPPITVKTDTLTTRLH
jgi:hypothetical protein